MPTIRQLGDALVRADRAGDSRAATILAAEITRLRRSAPSEPAPTPEPAPEETSLFGYVPETFKALGAGAAGTIEAGLAGASFLLPEEQEQAARRRIAELGGGVQGFLAPDAAYEGTYLDVVRGVGSTAPFLLAAPFGVPGVIAGAGLGIAAGAGEAGQRAAAAGATEEEISKAAGLGMIPGAFEMVAPARIVSRARRALGPKTETIAKALDDSISARLSRVKAGGLGRVGSAAVEEAAQEAATEVMQNLISQGVYDPETETFAGVGESAQIGGSVGGLLQLFTEMALGIKSRGAVGTPPSPPAAEVPPPPAAVETPPPSQEGGDLFGRQDLTSVLSADDLQALGLNLNKATAEKLFGLDLAVPEQRAQARRILTTYVNNTATQRLAPQTVSRISSLLRSDAFAVPEAPEQPGTPQGTQLDMIDIDETRQIQDLLDTEELAQLQAEEDAQLAAQEAQRQKTQRGSADEDVTLLGEQLGIDRQAESARKRRDILLPIIENRGIVDAPNLARAFSAELRRQGFTNTTPTESELATINRAVGMQEAVTSSETAQAENAAALQARQEAEQRAGVSELESLIPERRTPVSTTPPEPTLQEQQRTEQARLNRERLDRTGRGLEGQLEIPVIPRAKGTAAPQEAAPAAPDQGVPPQQLAFDLDAALDAAGVPKPAPVRERVKGKTLAEAKPELVAFAATPGVASDVSAAVTALVDSAPVEAAALAAESADTGSTLEPPASTRGVPKPPPMPRLKGELKSKAPEVFGKASASNLGRDDKYTPEGAMVQYLDTTDTPDLLLQTIAFEINRPLNTPANANALKRAKAAREWVQDNAPEYTPILDTMIGIAKQEEAYRTTREIKNAEDSAEKKLQRDRGDRQKTAAEDAKVVADYVAPVGGKAAARNDRLTMEALNAIIDFSATSDETVLADVDKSAVREQANDAMAAYDGVVTRALRADAVAATMVNADPSVTEQLKNGSASGALDSISKTTLNASVRRAADALKQAIAGVKVSMTDTLTDDKGNMLAGIYDAATDTLVINTSMPLSTHTVLHEATHAATIKVLKNPGHPTTQRLTQLYNNLKDKMPDEYAMESLEEFVAEVFSNSEFQTKLAAYRISGDKITGWDKFWEAVGRLFGMNYTTATASTEALELINTILATAPNTRNATTIASAIAKDDPAQAVNSLLSGGKNFIRDTPPSKLRDYVAVIARGSEKVRATLLNGLGLEGITNILKDVVPSAKEFEKIMYKMDGVRTQYMKVYGNLLNDINKAFNGDVKGRAAFNELVSFSTLNGADPTSDPDIVNKFWLRYGVINPSTNKAAQKEEKFNTKEQMEARKAQLSAQIASAKAANRPSPILGDVAGIKATEPTDLRKANDAKVRQLFASLTPTQRGAYTKLRDFYADVNDKIITAEEANIDRMEIDPEIKTSVKHTMLLRRILTGSIKPYFPLTRGGEFWVEFTYRDDDGQLVYGTGSFNSALERGKAIEKLRNMTEVDRDSIRERPLSEIEKRAYDGSIPIPFLTDLQKKIKDLELKDKDGKEVNPEGKRQLNEFLANVILRSLPEQAIVQSRQVRKGVAFFEGDATTALQQRGPQFITSLSNLSYMVELEQVSKKVRDERDKLPDSEVFYKEAATIVAGTKQETQAMTGFGSLPSYLQFSKNPYIANWARTLRSGTFTMTLAGNISSVAVNTSILPLVLQNTLAGRYGAFKATIASAMAAKLYVGSFGQVSREGITDLDADGKPLSPDATIRELGGFSITNDFSNDPKRQAGYKKLEPLTSIFKERGFDTRTQAAEMSELDSPTAPWINKLNYIGGFLFAHSERGIRQVSAISTYILEMEKLTGKKFGKLTDPDIAEYGAQAAETAIDTMLYVNSSALITTAPRIAQTSAGSLVWQFKRVPGQLLYSHFSMLNSIFKDLTGKARTPAELEEARALRNTFFYTAAVGGALVGVKGIPMYGVVATIANMFLDDDDDDFNTLIAKTMGEDKYYGLIANMFGVDITDRVSLTNLMVRDRGNYKPSNEYQYAVEVLLGPAFGVTMRSIQGGLRLFDDDPKNTDRAVEAMLPTALSNFAKSYRFATKGYETGRNDPIISGALPMGDILRQSLGFAPISTRSARDKLSLNIRKDLGRRDRRNGIIDKLVYAVSGEGEHSELLTQAWQEARAFNRDHPVFPIDVDTVLRSIRARQTRTEMAAITGGAPVDRKTALEMIESNREFEEGISWMDW